MLSIIFKVLTLIVLVSLSAVFVWSDGLGLLGLIFVLITTLLQIEYIRRRCIKFNLDDSASTSLIVLLIYYVLSLSTLYYLFGLTKLVLFLWQTINLLVSAEVYEVETWRIFRRKFKWLITDLPFSKRDITISAGIVFILANFTANPLINGSPTPWSNTPGIVFAIFAVVSLLYVWGLIKEQNHPILTILYSILIVFVVVIKYPLSYGYDTLLHQASLKQIFDTGQILPLMPFYVGQYSLQVYLKYFTSLSFIVIERIFTPLFFVGMTYVCSQHLLRRLHYNKFYVGYVPIAILLLTPTKFITTAPYYTALIWAMVAATYLYTYLFHRNKSDYYIALSAALASLFTHPFIGINIIIWTVGIGLYSKQQLVLKRHITVITSFVLASTMAVLCFVLYSWLNNYTVSLLSPLYYFKNFVNLFKDPAFYIKQDAPFYLWLIYFYESIGFSLLICLLLAEGFLNSDDERYRKTFNGPLLASIIIWLIYLYSRTRFILLTTVALVYFLVNRKNHRNILYLIITISFVVAGYLFISSIEVQNFSHNDQLDYSSRFLQAGKWFLWPLVMVALIKVGEFVKTHNVYYKIIISLGVTVLLTTNWYLTYPRNDDISRINVNNIRTEDYAVINFIHERERGKDNYIVLANQLFGGGAIQKHGFGPYYNSPWGQILYYSVPYGGELNQRFERIMSEIDFDPAIIDEIMDGTGVSGVYLIVTDYWPLHPRTQQQIEDAATDIFAFQDKVTIYYFNLPE